MNELQEIKERYFNAGLSYTKEQAEKDVAWLLVKVEQQTKDISAAMVAVIQHQDEIVRLKALLAARGQTLTDWD